MTLVSSLPIFLQQQLPQLPQRDFGPSMQGGAEIEDAGSSVAADDRMFVAVGKEVKECRATVEWAARNAEENKIVLLHIYQPANMIPMPLGAKFPANKLKPADVWAYRETEKLKINEILDEYSVICSRQRVQTEKLIIDMDDIEKGILETVVTHRISKLVMGAAADRHYSRNMNEPKSKKAKKVGQEADRLCRIWFICKGNLICTREPSEDRTVIWGAPSSPMASQSSTGSRPSPARLRSASQQQGERPRRLTNAFQDFLFRSKSDNYASSSLDGATTAFPSRHGISRDQTESPLIPPSPVDSTVGTNVGSDAISPSPSRSSGWSNSDDGCSSTPSASVERDDQSFLSRTFSVEGPILPALNESKEEEIFGSARIELEEKGVNDQLYEELDRAFVATENARRELFEELVKRRKAERDAIDAARKAKAAETSYAKEMKRRKEIEDQLQKEMQELENIKIQRLQVTEELQRARDQQSSLNAQIADSTRIVAELEEKVSAAEGLLVTVQRERDELLSERDDAVREAEELRQRRNEEEAVSTSRVPPDFSEFLFSELEDATNGFDPRMKIGEGGYGSVYKGQLRHTPVAVKMLHPQSMQGPSEFQQEVNVLSRVRHQNLVTLIGTCPESWALVYEYLPNGSLEDRLTCKDNTPPLSWQIRTRIAIEICSALLFLHSSNPHSIVHGDLKPANILLDSNFVSKLGDFGICRLIPRENSGATLCLLTVPKGTFMYMDPEFISTGLLTPKSDVYSFGIILLRLLTGKQPPRLAEEVEESLKMDSLHRMLDETAGDWPFVQAKQLAHIAVRCCEMKRQNRPDLATEVWMVLQPMMNLVGYCTSPSQLLSKESGRIPSYFICPILLEIMRDPHVAADGFTYEAEAIRGWLDNHETSPMTNIRLPHTELIPNRALKSAIQEWLQHP